MVVVLGQTAMYKSVCPGNHMKQRVQGGSEEAHQYAVHLHLLFCNPPRQ